MSDVNTETETAEKKTETMAEMLLRQLKAFVDTLPPTNAEASLIAARLTDEVIPFMVKVIGDITTSWRQLMIQRDAENFSLRLERVRKALEVVPKASVEEAMLIAGDFGVEEETEGGTSFDNYYQQLIAVALDAIKHYYMPHPAVTAVPPFPPAPAAAGPINAADDPQNAYEARHAAVYNTFRSIPLADTLAKALVLQTESAEASNRLVALLDLVKNAVENGDHTVRVVVMPHLPDIGEGIIS